MEKYAPGPISIVLVDDDAAFVAEMQRIMTGCFAEIEDGHTFTAFPDAEAFWREYASLRPDIVFFDIMLPGKSGLDMAKNLYRLDKRPAIVFVTSSPDFAVQGYGVNALGYIVKPTSDEAIRDIIIACLERLYPPHDPCLTLHDAGGTRAIRLRSIRYLESNYRRVIFYCDSETVECAGSLRDFQTRLSPDFFQLHKSFIVNLNRVQVLRTGEVFMDDGAAVPVSRRFRKQMAEVFFTRLAAETVSGP